MSSVNSLLQEEVHALYLSHHCWLVSWIRRRLGCVHHSSDLAQDTFVRIIDRSASLSHVLEPKAFLSTIAHGLMVDHIRRKELEQAYLQAVSYLPQREISSPEDRMRFIEALMRIDGLLDGLNPKTRRAFMLSRIEGMTYPEIAQQLSVSLRTVETYMAEAIRHVLANN